MTIRELYKINLNLSPYTIITILDMDKKGIVWEGPVYFIPEKFLKVKIVTFLGTKFKNGYFKEAIIDIKGMGELKL